MNLKLKRTSCSSHKLQKISPSSVKMPPCLPSVLINCNLTCTPDTQILVSLFHKGTQESLKSSWFPIKGREDEVVFEMHSYYQNVRMLSKMSADSSAGECVSRGVTIKGPEEKMKIWSEAWVYNLTQNEHKYMYIYSISIWKRGICGFPVSTEERYISYKLALAMGTCHLPLQGSCAAELPHILKGIWGGEQKLFTLCWQKHWQGRSSDS